MKIRIGLREGDFMFLFSLIVQCLVMLDISDRSVEPDLIYFPEIGYLLYHCWLPHEIASKSFRTSRIFIPVSLTEHVGFLIRFLFTFCHSMRHN